MPLIQPQMRTHHEGPRQRHGPGHAGLYEKAEGAVPSAMMEGNGKVDLTGDDDECQGQRNDAELRRGLCEGLVDVDVGEHGRGCEHEAEPHRKPDADDAEL